MLARRLQSNAKGAPPSPETAAIFSHRYGNFENAKLVAINAHGSPVFRSAPGIRIGNGLVAASHQHGTITVFGRSDDGAPLDLGATDGYSICRASPAGVTEVIERLPYAGAPGASTHLCRDWTYDPGTGLARNLRTGATINVGGTSGLSLQNSGHSLLWIRRASGGSTASTFTSQGIAQASTGSLPSRPHNIVYLNIGGAVAGNNLDCRVMDGFQASTTIPWDFNRSSPDGALLRRCAFTTDATIAARNGLAYVMAEIVTSEVNAAATGDPEVGLGGFVYTPVALTIRYSRRRGILVVTPTGTTDFICLREDEFVGGGAAMLGNNVGYFALKPGYLPWSGHNGTIPTSRIVDLPCPASALQALPDRLIGPIDGTSTTGTWSYDGAYLGPGGGGTVLRGKDILVRADVAGQPPTFSLDRGLSFQPYVLDPGETAAITGALTAAVSLQRF